MKYRLPTQPGEWIDRNRPIDFYFEGRAHTGYAGDTLSTALAANGVRVLGRSFKYHRPRGIFSLASHDANGMMADGQRVNLRADATPLESGVRFHAVNTWGGVLRDRWRILDRLSRFLPVGFYYKTFHRPQSLFPFWERRMRAMAGLDKVDPLHERERTPKDYAFCDVLVIGGGPAGLSAALAAAREGARVILADEQPRLGGSLNYRWHAEGVGPSLAQNLLRQIEACPNLTIRTGSLAAGYYADHWVALVDEIRLTKVRATSVVLATGCYEQPAVFGNNDLPGVMLASAAQRLMHQYAVKPLDRAVVLTANADGYRAALDMHARGVELAAVVDLRPAGEPSDAGQRVASLGVAVHRGSAVHLAIATRNKQGVQGCQIAPLDGVGGIDAAHSRFIACDGIAMSVGWASADGLLCQAGGKTTFCEELQQFLPKSLPAGTFVAGRANGVYDLASQQADGRRAGQAAAAHAGFGQAPNPAAPPRPTAAPTHPYAVFPHERAKCLVDLDEDVQYKDIVNAAQEGFDHVELLKRYSTFGMGPSQGKTANVNAIRILAKIKGQKVGDTGTTTARPFVQPVPLAILAGRGFHPHRETPLHARHRAQGARFLTAGDWHRPAYYGSERDPRDACIAAEVQAVRERAGIVDVSTLGKIEICGADAAQFLERMYTGRFANMKVGVTRYGLMCDESGVVIDDGVVARLGEDRFYVTTTTTAAAGVYREMQRWAILWGLRVTLINLTGQFAAINLAGPRARQILAPLCELDLQATAFPYLGVREGAVLGVRARMLRVGFVGETGYEIHLPAQSAARVWDGLMQAGAAHGLRPFGVEAQRVLRLEKGHIIIGQDTDGLTVPFEAGLDWAIKADKPFFIGGRSLQIVRRKPLTRQLVGFTLGENYRGPVPLECNLVIADGEIAGRVTSIAASPTLKREIGLAYVTPAQAQPGTTLDIRLDDGATVPATVAPFPFYDPENARQK